MRDARGDNLIGRPFGFTLEASRLEEVEDDGSEDVLDDIQ